MTKAKFLWPVILKSRRGQRNKWRSSRGHLCTFELQIFLAVVPIPSFEFIFVVGRYIVNVAWLPLLVSQELYKWIKMIHWRHIYYYFTRLIFFVHYYLHNTVICYQSLFHYIFSSYNGFISVFYKVHPSLGKSLPYKFCIFYKPNETFVFFECHMVDYVNAE